MSFSQGEIRRALTSKVGFEFDPAGSHPAFVFWHDGEVVARTHMSHGSNKAVSPGVVAAMARQLGVTGPQLRGCINCTVDGEVFVDLLLQG